MGAFFIVIFIVLVPLSFLYAKISASPGSLFLIHTARTVNRAERSPAFPVPGTSH